MLGTQNNSFHRLLEELDKLVEKKIIDEKIIVQAGYTKYESKNMKIKNDRKNFRNYSRLQCRKSTPDLSRQRPGADLSKS